MAGSYLLDLALFYVTLFYCFFFFFSPCLFLVPTAPVSTSSLHFFVIIFVTIETQVMPGTIIEKFAQVVEVQRRRFFLSDAQIRFVPQDIIPAQIDALHRMIFWDWV